MSAPPPLEPTLEPVPDRLPLPILQGERCVLRALVATDAESVRRHGDNVNIARNMFDGFPSPYTAEIADAWCGHEANTGLWGYVWGIVVGGEVIGCIGLVPGKGALRCNAEVGYWIGEAHWRRGIVGDALRQVVDWAFAALPELTRIFAGAFAWNEGSQAVARHCGFVLEGVQKLAAMKDEQAVDRVVWATSRPQAGVRPANIDLALATAAAIAMERS